MTPRALIECDGFRWVFDHSDTQSGAPAYRCAKLDAKVFPPRAPHPSYLLVVERTYSRTFTSREDAMHAAYGFALVVARRRLARLEKLRGVSS